MIPPPIKKRLKTQIRRSKNQVCATGVQIHDIMLVWKGGEWIRTPMNIDSFLYLVVADPTNPHIKKNPYRLGKTSHRKHTPV